MIKTKHDLMMIRHSRVITDPFPEHTDYKVFQAMRNKHSSDQHGRGEEVNAKELIAKLEELVKE